MRHDNTTAIKRVFVLTGAILLLLLFFGVAKALASEIADLRKYLESRAQLDSADISKMERGEMVSRLLPAEDKHEVAFCGVISIGAKPENAFEIFEDRLSRLDKKSLMAFGSFSDSPTLADLEGLTLEKGDIEALKTCRVGNCGLKLSAEMIERFQNEVEWESANYSQQATDLFRRLILEYVLDYRARGQAALIEYNNKPQALSLRAENDILLKELSWLDKFAPEYFRYLQDPTAAEPPNVKKSIGWAKIKFGLKPVILITEAITYSTAKSGSDYLLSVSKQIYANHYVDSSLGLIAVVQDPRSEASDSSYLLYVNHSRSSVLRGILGKITRKIVQHEVMEKLELLLQNTKSYAEYDRTKQDLPQPGPTIWQKISSWTITNPYFVGLLVLIAVGLLLKTRIAKPAANDPVDV